MIKDGYHFGNGVNEDTRYGSGIYADRLSSIPKLVRLDMMRR